MDRHWQKAWRQQMVKAFPRSMTAGGRAMERADRAAVQRSIRQWSLPQHIVCMPMCSRRLHSASRVDDVHCRIRRRVHLYSTTAYRLEALCELRLMACMRACVLVALPARISRGCSCAAWWLVPFMVSKCICRAARTRALCVKVSMQCPLYITRDP